MNLKEWLETTGSKAEDLRITDSTARPVMVGDTTAYNKIELTLVTDIRPSKPAPAEFQIGDHLSLDPDGYVIKFGSRSGDFFGTALESPGASETVLVQMDTGCTVKMPTRPAEDSVEFRVGDKIEFALCGAKTQGKVMSISTALYSSSRGPLLGFTSMGGVTGTRYSTECTLISRAKETKSFDLNDRVSFKFGGVEFRGFVTRKYRSYDNPILEILTDSSGTYAMNECDCEVLDMNGAKITDGAIQSLTVHPDNFQQFEVGDSVSVDGSGHVWKVGTAGKYAMGGIVKAPNDGVPIPIGDGMSPGRCSSAPITCECGAAATQGQHSHWCPVFNAAERY